VKIFIHFRHLREVLYAHALPRRYQIILLLPGFNLAGNSIGSSGDGVLAGSVQADRGLALSLVEPIGGGVGDSE